MPRSDIMSITRLHYIISSSLQMAQSAAQVLGSSQDEIQNLFECYMLYLSVCYIHTCLHATDCYIHRCILCKLHEPCYMHECHMYCPMICDDLLSFNDLRTFRNWLQQIFCSRPVLRPMDLHTFVLYFDKKSDVISISVPQYAIRNQNGSNH